VGARPRTCARRIEILAQAPVRRVVPRKPPRKKASAFLLVHKFTERAAEQRDPTENSEHFSSYSTQYGMSLGLACRPVRSRLSGRPLPLSVHVARMIYLLRVCTGVCDTVYGTRCTSRVRVPCAQMSRCLIFHLIYRTL
jgi:hypothetical protein